MYQRRRRALEWLPVSEAVMDRALQVQVTGQPVRRQFEPGG
jgi:hypothetical protein